MNLPSRPLSRRWLVRGVVALVVVLLVAPATISGVTYVLTDEDPGNLRASVDEPANGTTIISIQGFHFQGMANENKPARLVAVGPRGEVEWVHDGSGFDATWFYDVDPLDNGHLLVTATAEGETLVYELDPDTQERVWTERLPIADTHDVDLINDDELLVANMREDGKDDRLFVYNRTRGEIVWEWRFDDHYPEDVGGPSNDWTHVNDVDKIDEGEYLASPRNFDQVIVVNRSTDEIEMRLGEDDDHDTLYEQHNPMYLESEDGDPTVLVADSENDRIVEYEREGGGDGETGTDGEWTRTWSIGTEGLSWPRDADRLPDGDTLVVDTMNQRVFETTPEGEVVWEFRAPWAPYDVERMQLGDEPGGPTATDMNASGDHDLTGSSLSVRDGEGVSFWTVETFEDTPVEAQATEFARTWAHVTPWIRPVWMTGWEFLALMVGSVAVVGWGLGEVVYQRRRIRRGVSSLTGKVTEWNDRRGAE
ncbi:aryl-sulfate sulfotransferase [Halorussus salilacus]|uniref:aryl-sulfate sulfotransferase n=1 Tax=Halorussus salilacus TaxID=2953750 RepID=UPI0020A0B57D|nr:aryl-sulfate sulfotransferase [Halorussus salilacus]USZ66880.1 aryl-sulfate sulfotransferase [Halorussus salilacus]